MSEDNFENLSKKERRILARETRKSEENKSSLISKIIRISIYLLLLLGIGFILYSFLKPSSNSENINTESLTIADNDWVKGDRESKNILFEFSDFQCPACASYQPLVKQISEELSGQVKVVYKHFPLSSIHKNAFDAARVSEAAGKQEKFWEMHDLLFNLQDDWAEENNAYLKFEEYAKSLELDIDIFKIDFESQDVRSKIENDIKLGNSLRINATPTFFLNGKKLNLPITFDKIKSLLE